MYSFLSLSSVSPRALERWSQGHALACSPWTVWRGDLSKPPASPPLSASRFRGCLTAPSTSFHAAPRPMLLLLYLSHIPVEQQHGLEILNNKKKQHGQEYLSSRGDTKSDVLAIGKVGESWKLQQHSTRPFQCFAKLNLSTQPWRCLCWQLLTAIGETVTTS